MSLRIGKEVDLETDRRYLQHNRSHAIGDLYDALPELLTNCDDSYGRLYKAGVISRDGGDVLIEYLGQRKDASRIVLRDRAEGMDEKDMEAKLLHVGGYEAKSGSRGYMGRGAKDCTELGDLFFESIKNDRYLKCRISHALKLRLDETGPVTPQKREDLGIPRGNGTAVTLHLREGVRLPRFENLAHDLPWHFALRDIMAEDSPSRVMLRKIGEQKSTRLVYRQPVGEIVVDENFDVPGFLGAKARFRLWRSVEPLDDLKARFERCGILVKGRRAIHECSFLSDEFKSDPNARHYFGRLECDYIDALLAEYEERRAKGEHHPLDNPRLVIDPNRREGIVREHPFSKALFEVPIRHIRRLLAHERDVERSKSLKVADARTRLRLSRLAKLATRFFQDRLEELEELSESDAVDDTAFAQKGTLLFPTYLRLGVGQEKRMTLYVRREKVGDESAPISVECDVADVALIKGSPFTLRPHRIQPDRLVGSFSVKGLAIHPAVLITVRGDGVPPAEAMLQVVADEVRDRIFSEGVEFERPEYSVIQGRTKSLRLLAKFPEIVRAETEAVVSSSDTNRTATIGRCKFVPRVGTNFAEGSVTIRGGKLHSLAAIRVEVNGYSAEAMITVIDKPQRGIPVEVDIRDQDFGNFRAIWADREGKPNLLLISAKDEYLARCLGKPPNFPGQHHPVSRALIAEIFAESVCRKLLSLEAKRRPFDFPWREMAGPHLIVDDVFANFISASAKYQGRHMKPCWGTKTLAR